MQVGNTLAVDYNLMDYQKGERKTISHVDKEQDLGIWCTADLKPTLQYQHAVSKAMKALGLIKTFKYFNTKSLAKLYKTYVRPHLEYCVQVCHSGLLFWWVTLMLWRGFNQTNTQYC